MIFRIEKLIRRARRATSRNQWLVKILGLSVASQSADTKNAERKHGLIILQIDGLSKQQLSKALNSNRMPFLASLLNNEHYHLDSLYSGIPSSTPSVQGELFYGVKGCVPAFSFKRHQDNKVVVMLEPNAAATVEAQLVEKGGQPLLRDGSAFSNIFSGGAKESSFCASSMGWSSVMPTNNIVKMAIFAVLNAYSFLRVAVLMVVELLLALIDFVRGLIGGRDLLQELKFVPTRVAACVLMRELVTIGVKLDAARGLPIIHANLIGYDEQAHRRGPQSKFAHWSLGGIDNAIKRIWNSAERSEIRDYDIWVYSDHGQEITTSFPKAHQQSIKTAIQNVFSERFDSIDKEGGEDGQENSQEKGSQDIDSSQASKRRRASHSESSGVWSSRVNWLGIPNFEKWFAAKEERKIQTKKQPEVIAMGPVGFVYSNEDLSVVDKTEIAKAMVAKATVPMVMVANRDSVQAKVMRDIKQQSMVSAWTAEACYQLPQDKVQVLGADHPFLDDVCDDLINLCFHPDSGDFVISGWRPGEPTMSFRIENGAHAGPGMNETHAFALTPGDTQFSTSGKNYLRMTNLRETALRQLGRSTSSTPSNASSRLPENIVAENEQIPKSHSLAELPSAKAADKSHCLRVLTYNIHSCVGMDGKLSTARIARVIAQYQPDVVALQELDVDNSQSGQLDQAHRIAEELGMVIHFHPIRHVEQGRFGNAILTDLPIKVVKAEHLSTSDSISKKIGGAAGAAFNEPRGALWVEVQFNGKAVNIITTHLGLTPKEQRVQVEALLSEEWLAHPDCKAPLILCGDFNATPRHQTYRSLSKVLRDAQLQIDYQQPLKTFSGRYPTIRIDHVFVDQSIEVDAVMVPKSSLAKLASDHLPLVVDVDLSGSD